MSPPLLQMTSSYDISLSSFRYSSSNRTQARSSSFFATLAQTGNPISCLTSSTSHTWIINSGATDHMTENRGIMSSFTLALSSKSVVLANGSYTLVQGIGIAITTLTLPLSYLLPHFSFNMLTVSKITKVLNCTVIFFSETLCISEAWDEEDDWYMT